MTSFFSKTAAAFLTLLTFTSSAQQVSRCATDEKLTQKLLENPAAAERFFSIQEKAREIKQDREAGIKGGGGLRIIPVVFHVIHQGGIENISKAQIEDQIRVLNEDFTRTNADTVNTRDIFKPVAANPNINFRLAQLDPDGNCTEGIVRVFSDQTNNAGDNVKALSWWDNSKYLNVWVVRTIASDGTAGTTLGFSSLPGLGSDGDDGVVVRADCIGTIENVNQQIAGTGRTLTHEIGHYLGLFHTFQGACSGGFFGEPIEDTPPVADASFGCDTTANSCTNDSPDLPDMIENYMDYANDECMNIFTLGQKDVMDGTLSDARGTLVSGGNLIATGTDGSAAVPCAPVADFYATHTLVCFNEVVNFEDNSYNGVVDSREWSFPTGSPSTSVSATPNVTFATAGFHNVSLTVTNTQGTDSKTVNSYIYVSPATAPVSNWQYYESFEGDNSNNEWLVFNEGNITTTWEHVSTAAYSGSKCMKISNRNGNTSGAIDNLILQTIDLSAINSPTMKFKVSNVQRPGSTFSDPSSDKLRVMISTNCGKTWQQRYTETGADLATATASNNAFTPTAQSQWREETVNLASFATQTKVMIRFEATSDEGNNLYIDDINITSPVGIEENSDNAFGLEVYPNPSENSVFVNFNLGAEEQVELVLTDITGKTIKTYFNTRLNKGAHSVVINKNELTASGIYFLSLKTNQSITVRKILFF